MSVVDRIYPSLDFRLNSLKSDFDMSPLETEMGPYGNTPLADEFWVVFRVDVDSDWLLKFDTVTFCRVGDQPNLYLALTKP